MSKAMMKPDEMQILKCASVKINEDTMLIATQQYHTEKDPVTSKNDKSKSRYRWMARVCKTEDLKKTVQDMFSDAHRLEPWKWPNDPSWNGKMYTTDSTNYCGARWLNLRISKAVDWDTGMKWLSGCARGKEDKNHNAAYDTEEYKADNGDIVSLTDREALLNHVGQNLWKPMYLKTQPHPDNF